jgi:hypothetical protein
LIEVIRSSGEEMWRVDAYQIPYYSRGIEGEKRIHPRFADCLNHLTIINRYIVAMKSWNSGGKHLNQS